MPEAKSTLNTTVAALAAELAHQVNNPLAVVIASVGSLERLTEQIASGQAGEDDRTELAEVLGDINKGLTRIRTVVANLNTLAFRIVEKENLLGDPFPAKNR